MECLYKVSIFVLFLINDVITLHTNKIYNRVLAFCVQYYRFKILCNVKYFRSSSQVSRILEFLKLKANINCFLSYFRVHIYQYRMQRVYEVSIFLLFVFIVDITSFTNYISNMVWAFCVQCY